MAPVKNITGTSTSPISLSRHIGFPDRRAGLLRLDAWLLQPASRPPRPAGRRSGSDLMLVLAMGCPLWLWRRPCGYGHERGAKA